MKVVRWILLALAIGLLLASVVYLLWSSRPIYADVNRVDPALQALNDRLSESSSASVQFRESFVEAGGQRLHVVEAGEGTTVLFLHGFPSFWLSNLRQMQALSADYRVIAIDGLGVGNSDAPTDLEPYHLEAMSRQLMDVLDQLGVGELHIVGHDWGGVFAGGLAQRYPQRVQTVTIMAAIPQNVFLQVLSESEQARADFAYIETFKSANPLMLGVLGADRLVWEGAYQPLVESGDLSEREGELFRQGTSDLRRLNAHLNWYRANFPTPDAITESDYWPSKTARITQPSLFIYGTGDRISAPVLDGLKAASDSMRVLSFDKVGHWPHVERADEVTQAIRQLIETKP